MYPYKTNLNTDTNDSPATAITAGNYYDSTENFTMYLMFQPNIGANPIWVPLAAVSWNWAASIEPEGTGWAFLFSPAAVPGGYTTGTVPSSFPNWSGFCDPSN